MDSDPYAPQSPNLSEEEEEPEQPHPQHQQYRGSVSHISPFVTSTDSTSPLFNFPPSAASTNFQHQRQRQTSSADTTSSQHHSAMKGERDSDEDDFKPDKAKASSRKRAKKENPDLGNGDGPAFAHGIDVKTKFPVARIKRIMQADEDVGKVAQVTPVAVSKALELFMISIVTKAATQARERSSKRVLATHLKQAVTKEEQFDFLTDIVSKVPDAPAQQAKNEGDSDDPMEGVKKKRAAPRRKRKQTD